MHNEKHHRPHPSDVPLYGGVSGAFLPIPSFELTEGIRLQRTYAHVMAPYILAFGRAAEGSPHPGPWKSASGGLGFDIEFEIVVPLGDRPTNFTRLNTIWWIAALIRLNQPCDLRVPVISTESFSIIAQELKEPTFWPIEMTPRRLTYIGGQTNTLELRTLKWLADHWQRSSSLMDIPSFNAAFQAFDQASWSHDVGSALLMLWAAIEALFRPGNRDIARTLSICIACYLEGPDASRDRLFARVRDLYKLRGSTAHAAVTPQTQTASAVFEIGRRCFIKAFDQCILPEASGLLNKWKSKA